MADQFSISGSSPQLQQNIFQAVNAGMRTLGISAEEYDQYFRTALMLQSNVLASTAISDIAEKLKEAGGTLDPALSRQVETMRSNRANYLPESLRLVIELGPNDRNIPRLQRLLQQAPQHQGAIVGTHTQGFNNHFGRFQDFKPDQIGDWHRVYDQYNDWLRVHPQHHSLQANEAAAPENLLQRYASGAPLITPDSLLYPRITINSENVEYISPPAARFIPAAMQLALRMAAQSKQMPAMVVDRPCKDIARFGQALERQVSTENASIGNMEATMRGMPTEYTCSDECTPETKKFFRALNKVARLTGEPIITFDHNLRLRMYSNLQITSYLTSEQLQQYVNQNFEDFELEDVLLHGNRPTASEIPASIRPTLTRNEVPCEARDLMQALQRDTMNIEFQRQLMTGLHDYMRDRFPGFSHLELTGEAPLRNPNVDSIVRDLRSIMPGEGRITVYTGRELVMDAYASGQKPMHELATRPDTRHITEYFDLNHASAGAILMASIDTTAHFLAGDNGRDNRELKEALNELQAAYAAAIVSPEEKHRQQAEEQRLREEKIRQAEEATRERQRRIEAAEAQKRELEQQELLVPAAFIYSQEYAGMQSFKTIAEQPASSKPANRPKEVAAQRRLNDVALQQLNPVTRELNTKFPPHKDLATALLKGPKPHPLAAMLGHICGGDGSIPSIPPQYRENVRRELERTFTYRSDGSPLDEANVERHQRLVQAISGAPLLLVAALGSPEQVSESAKIQRALFPEKSKDRPDAAAEVALRVRQSMLAEQALQNAGVEPPAPLLVASAAPNPPDPIKPPDADQQGTADELFKRVDRIIGQYRGRLPPVPQEGEGAAPALAPMQFRCSLGMEDGFPIQMEMWDMNGQNRRVVQLRLDVPALNDALDLKRRVQTHVLYPPLQGVYPYREAGQAVSPPSHSRYDPIPNVAPTERLRQDNGTWQVELTFMHPPAQGQPAQAEHMMVNLGVQQDPQNYQEAETRRDWVLLHLQNARTAGQTLTRGDLNDAVFAQYNAAWDPPDARRVPGLPHEITYVDPADRQPGQLAFHIPESHLEIGSMTLERTPNQSWVLPIKFYPRNAEARGLGRAVLLCTADPLEADRRATEFVTALVNGENAMAAQYPGSTWNINAANQVDPPRLHAVARITHEQNRAARTPGTATQFDGGDRWRLLRMEPPIIEAECHHAVLMRMEPPANDTVTFYVGAIRNLPQAGTTANGPPGMPEPVMEDLGRRLERPITVPVSMQAQIPQLVAAINTQFRDVVRETFDRRTVAHYSPNNAALEKAKEDYDTNLIVQAFVRSIEHVMGQANGTGTAASPPPATPPQNNGTTVEASDTSPDSRDPSGSGDYRPGDPHHHHDPRNDMDRIDEIHPHKRRQRESGWNTNL